jgi:hypothetical protein
VLEIICSMKPYIITSRSLIIARFLASNTTTAISVHCLLSIRFSLMFIKTCTLSNHVIYHLILNIRIVTKNVRETKGQSKMDNPDKLITQDT